MSSAKRSSTTSRWSRFNKVLYYLNLKTETPKKREVIESKWGRLRNMSAEKAAVFATGVMAAVQGIKGNSIYFKDLTLAKRRDLITYLVSAGVPRSLLVGMEASLLSVLLLYAMYKMATTVIPSVVFQMRFKKFVAIAKKVREEKVKNQNTEALLNNVDGGDEVREEKVKNQNTEALLNNVDGGDEEKIKIFVTKQDMKEYIHLAQTKAHRFRKSKQYILFDDYNAAAEILSCDETIEDLDIDTLSQTLDPEFIDNVSKTIQKNCYKNQNTLQRMGMLSNVAEENASIITRMSDKASEMKASVTNFVKSIPSKLEPLKNTLTDNVAQLFDFVGSTFRRLIGRGSPNSEEEEDLG